MVHVVVRVHCGFLVVVKFLLCDVIIIKGNENSEVGLREAEYCQFDTFSPKCSSSEVILIETALYGRMKKGKCISEEEIKASGSLVHDPKFFGCSVDVTDKLHDKCSFKKECSVKIYDPELKGTNPCLPTLNLHLEAKYDCLTVYQTDNLNCILPALSSSKFLTSESLNEKLCGSNKSPWIIEAPKGQKINVEFTERQGKRSCYDFGIVLQDTSTGKNQSLCGDSYMAESYGGKVVKSSSNTMKMFVNQPVDAMDKFLLRIKAEGCLDIIPPEDTWLKRTNDDIVIGCYSSKQTWYLRCENGQWTGSIGNCSQQSVNSFTKEDESVEKLKSNEFMPKHQQILAIVSIFGMGVVICSMIICVGAVCSRRYSLTKKGGQLKLSLNAYEQAYNHHTYQPDVTDDFRMNHNISSDGEVKTSHVMENDQTYFVLEDEKGMEK